MAQKHEDILSIDQFLGLNQSADNLRLSYAADGYNFSVKHGVLQSVRIPRECKVSSDFEPDFTFVTDDNGQIDPRLFTRTIGIISQRWKDGYSGAIPADTTWLVTVMNGKIYARKNVNGITYNFNQTDWIEVYDGAFQSDLFDCVTYELNYSPPMILDALTHIRLFNESIKAYAYDFDDKTYHFIQVDSESNNLYYINNNGERITPLPLKHYIKQIYDYPVDALVMSNSKDGLHIVYCNSLGAGKETLLKASAIKMRPDDEEQPLKFGCIARFSERIWGAGIETDPDKLVYSAPYDIFNWEQNNEDPDNGAGDIQQPDWDGDGFTALKSFGNQLVCFKRNSIWAITGTSPGDFYMRKQYGHGTIYEDSIAVYNGNVFFITDTGLHAYDAINVNPVKYGCLNKAFEQFSFGNSRTSIGCVCAAKYYFTLDTSYTGYTGNSIYCYDTVEGTISAYKFSGGFYIPRAITAYNDTVYMLYSNGYKWKLAELDGTGAAEMYYITAWQDFGAKNVIKRDFEVYIMPQVDMGDNVEIEIGIETEYKKKTKTVIFTSGKIKRIKLNAKGRRFRFWLKSKQQEDHWKLSGGIQIAYELDYD